MRRTTVVLAAVMALEACVTAEPVRYQKPGASKVERERDEAECALAALGPDKPGLAAPPLPIDRDVVDRCMAARGYSVRAGL